ncbi:NACHT, LRR and PYD domains-containing protein 1b allele 2 isoform X8 [Epinephelus moara]|uniref:NACHT, LRR and PYD domains-containing protein 1b allele 2 isoform X8 n=1 Tax=Epinephelus moara TaxID=300413 RepID=UPI00214F1A7C|nr:NACHT, LRR and PYD domains-containing protein 1b allele 2 isoform X8 [Epinephelus moara]XP_049923706.1 NACHT, LRR and PYD domains-containing protein 1b allele 2 isoform X8 [Epinephelus moara]
MDDTYQYPVFFECQSLADNQVKSLQTYFSIRHRSGGGECGSLRRVNDKTYSIAFRHRGDQQAVLQRSKHVMDDLVFTVRGSLERHAQGHVVLQGPQSMPAPSPPDWMEWARAMRAVGDRLLQGMFTRNSAPSLRGFLLGAAAEDTARGATAESSGNGASVEIIKGTTETQQDSSDWTKLEPVINTVDEAQIYSLQSGAGRFECSVSALRWICKEKVSFKYQFCSWEEHMRRPSCMDYMPAGPLLDITVTAGKLEEVHLPHWVCVDENSTMSDMFVVLHVETCGDVLEQVSEVTSSHVKLVQPTFSPVGVMILKKLGIPFHFDTLVYKTNKEFLTLDVYLVPPDPSLQQVVEKLQNSCRSRRILKPGPDKSMQLGNNFSLKTDLVDAKIQPSVRELRHGSSNVFEVFVRNADSDFTLRLESKEDIFWTCTIHKGDYQSQSTDDKQGQHFVDHHRTALIERVCDTKAILDELVDRGLISDESYDAVRALKTTRDQMRDIHRFVTAAGTKGKDALYEILKGMKSMRPLVSELEGSG